MKRKDTRNVEMEARPGTSTGGETRQGISDATAAAREKANMAIIEAEKYKTAVAGAAPGKALNVIDTLPIKRVIDDDQFIHIHSHVDPTIISKIERGEFVELEKLFKRNKTTSNDTDECRLEMIKRDGKMTFEPVNDKDSKITSIRKWEQSFRVYASIYSRANPTRAAEIWQYVETIHRAAGKYSWENVSSYDYQFRRWMHENPLRNWGKTLTQIWNLELTDVLVRNHEKHNKSLSKSNNRETLCWKFNKGKCNDQHCRYEHKCSFCLRYGHPFVKCRKRESSRHDSPKKSKREEKK